MDTTLREEIIYRPARRAAAFLLLVAGSFASWAALAGPQAPGSDGPLGAEGFVRVGAGPVGYASDVRLIENDERKGDAEELEKSPSIPPGDDFPSEEDVSEDLPGVPEEAEES